MCGVPGSESGRAVRSRSEALKIVAPCVHLTPVVPLVLPTGSSWSGLSPPVCPIASNWSPSGGDPEVDCTTMRLWTWLLPALMPAAVLAQDANHDPTPALRALAQMRFAGAQQMAERALRERPDEARWHYVLGEALANQTNAVSPVRLIGHARRTRAAYERAAALAPDDPVVLEGMAHFRSQAPRLFGGDRGEAVALGDRLHARNAALGASVAALARWRRNATRDRAAADSLVERQLRAQPLDSTTRLRAAEYYFATGRSARVPPILTPHLERAPDDAIARLLLGRSYAQLGEYPAARPQLERAAAAWTETAWYPRLVAQWQLTRTLIGLRDTAAARASAERILTIAPHHRGATRLLDSLRVVQTAR